MTLAATLTEFGFSAGWSVIRRLPDRVAASVFERTADAMWARRGPSVRMLEANLMRVVGPDVDESDLRALSRDAVRRYMRYWCEAFRLPGWSHERIVESFICYDEHLLVEALAEERGVVLALPHMGNWDHAAAWATLRHRQIVSVAERLEPEGLYEQFLEFRRELGMEILPLTGGESDTFRTLVSRLRAGGMVALLADRDLSARGVPVDFFGATATMPAGPAALAVTTGAVLLPATMWYDGDKSCARIHPRLATEAKGEPRNAVAARLTQEIADNFASGISAHPADWHMMQPLWWDDLDPQRRRPLADRTA